LRILVGPSLAKRRKLSHKRKRDDRRVKARIACAGGQLGVKTAFPGMDSRRRVLEKPGWRDAAGVATGG
jgi:hypothetical protein